MNIYTNNTFEGYWPVGSAAVVTAESREAAADALNARLRSMGLADLVKPKHMIPFPAADEDPDGVRILWDGNY